MRRSVPFLALSLLLAAGCGGEPTAAEPRDVVGTWVLERFGGEPVPATIPYQGSTFTVESSVITFGADGHYSIAARAILNSLVSGGPPTRVSTASGTYTYAGAVVRFTPSGDAPWTARVAGSTLTTDTEPVGIYRRQ
jgi:hypothetical protein